MKALLYSFIALFITFNTLHAQTVSSELNYQALVRDKAGNLIGGTEGQDYEVIIRIWKAPGSTDTSDLIWAERYSTQIIEGRVSLLLGSGARIPEYQTVSDDGKHPALDEVFKGEEGEVNVVRYAEVLYAAKGENVLNNYTVIAPRQKITPAAFALRAKSSEIADFATTIKDGAITTSSIAEKAITSVQLGDLSVISGKIGSEAVSASNLRNDSVITTKVKDSAITEAKVADGAITTAKVKDSAITEAKVAKDAITTAKVKDSAITGDKIAQKTLSDTHFKVIPPRLTVVENPVFVEFESEGETEYANVTLYEGSNYNVTKNTEQKALNPDKDVEQHTYSIVFPSDYTDDKQAVLVTVNSFINTKSLGSYNHDKEAPKLIPEYMAHQYEILRLLQKSHTDAVPLDPRSTHSSVFHASHVGFSGFKVSNSQAILPLQEFPTVKDANGNSQKGIIIQIDHNTIKHDSDNESQIRLRLQFTGFM